MDATRTTTAPQPRAEQTRRRARQACKTCNTRKVRCDVIDVWPCTNCKTSSAECELTVSRRGKYDRYARTSPPNPDRADQEAPESSSFQGTYPLSNDHASDPNILAPRGTNSLLNDHSRAVYDQRQSISSSPHSKRTGSFHDSPKNLPREAECVLFLGESSSMSSVLEPQSTSSLTHNQNSANNSRLRYPVPKSIKTRQFTRPIEENRRAAKIESLQQEGAFTFPSREICEILLHSYFKWFHPCFPILDKAAISAAYTSNTMSPLLFQAMLFIGASHCDTNVFQPLGLGDRHDVRYLFYTRAKDIYDADYETDKCMVLQALFLLSFWRPGPLQEKDTRHWLGAAISLAQTKGTHRSGVNVDLRLLRQRKRIWWSLYVRDRQCSAAYGLPMHIRDEDSDLEELEVSDFETDEGLVNPEIFGTQQLHHVHYAIQVAKLARILGKIILTEFAPKRHDRAEIYRPEIHEELIQWELELPFDMKSPATAEGPEGIWVDMLHVTANNLYILLYRSAYLTAQASPSGEGGQPAFQAACKNTQIVENMLSNGTMRHGHVHLITGLFNSLCIHTVHLRRSTDIAQKLAEYRAQLCLLGLKELQAPWDVKNWVLELFLQFLDRSTAARLQLGEDDQSSSYPSSPWNTPMSNSAVLQAETMRDNMFAQEGPMEQSQGPTINHIEIPRYFGRMDPEHFSLNELCPELFATNAFGTNVAEYYNFSMPGENGLNEAEMSYLARCL